MTSILASLASLLQGVCVIMVLAYGLTRTRLFAAILAPAQRRAIWPPWP
jgi:LytS/YehU family sensor histidine kinase